MTDAHWNHETTNFLLFGEFVWDSQLLFFLFLANFNERRSPCMPLHTALRMNLPTHDDDVSVMYVCHVCCMMHKHLFGKPLHRNHTSYIHVCMYTHGFLFFSGAALTLRTQGEGYTHGRLCLWLDSIKKIVDNLDVGLEIVLRMHRKHSRCK